MIGTFRRLAIQLSAMTLARNSATVMSLTVWNKTRLVIEQQQGRVVDIHQGLATTAVENMCHFVLLLSVADYPFHLRSVLGGPRSFLERGRFA